MLVDRSLPRLLTGCAIATAVLAASTACRQQRPPQTPETAAAPTPILPAPASAAAPQPELPIQVLPPEPVPVRFQAWDGQELEGTFYPPAEIPSPVVVLMHWIRSDESDWSAVARWLQNRLAPSGPPSADFPWLDPPWFPDTASNRGYAVLTFTFRGCQGGCRGFDPQGWLIDARSVLQVAASQLGVDPMRVVAIGASIGGDGAIDACAWLSGEQGAARCVAAVSLSPGGYLGVPYAQAVDALIEGLKRAGALPAHPVALCLADVLSSIADFLADAVGP